MTSFTQPILMDTSWFYEDFSLLYFWRILSHPLITTSLVVLSLSYSPYVLSLTWTSSLVQMYSFSLDSSAPSLIHLVCQLVTLSKILFILLTFCFPVIPTIKNSIFVFPLPALFLINAQSFFRSLLKDHVLRAYSHSTDKFWPLCFIFSQWPAQFLHSTCQSS